MKRQTDVVVIGSGFAGSLSALVLSRLGRSVHVIDCNCHPRFTIGESSTPAANLILAELTDRFELPALAPLAHYGSWKQCLPQLDCGLKRGFSYYQHRPGRPFEPTPDHQFELMVAASQSDENGDTHWLRSDVDAFLVSQLAGAGVSLEQNTRVRKIDPTSSGDGWQLQLSNANGDWEHHCRLIVDASGSGQVLATQLGLENRLDQLRTHSAAVYSHFDQLLPWHQWLREHGVDTVDHPFHTDRAAQHHLLDGGWMWQLRFDSGRTSTGIVYDPRQPTPAADWSAWLEQYPSLADLFQQARLSRVPGTLFTTGRLQRWVAPAAGPGWLLLPHSAGFIDPLHSTGIAHSMCALERLADMVEGHWGRDSMNDQLQLYSDRLECEVKLIDSLVAGCYQALPCMELFRCFSMLYFAAAIAYEESRLASARDTQDGFLLAENRDFVALVEDQTAQLEALMEDKPPKPSAAQGFVDQFRIALQPFNRVGLCDPAQNQMYAYTATV